MTGIDRLPAGLRAAAEAIARNDYERWGRKPSADILGSLRHQPSRVDQYVRDARDALAAAAAADAPTPEPVACERAPAEIIRSGDVEGRLWATLSAIAGMSDNPRAAAFARRALEEVEPTLSARRRRAAVRVERRIAAEASA